MTRYIRGLAGAIAALLPPALLVIATSATAGINTWTSSGLDGGVVSSIGWHPTRSNQVMVVAGRVYRSVDSGTHWTAASAIPVGGKFVFDPRDPDRILLLGDVIRLSTDGGASFSTIAPVPAGAGFLRDAVMTPDATTLYAMGVRSVLRSTDFGLTWTQFSNGLPGGTDYATRLRVSPSSPGTLFVSFAFGGLFKSTDAGASWTHLPSPGPGVIDFSISPHNAAHLLASTSGTLWRSSDGGVNWTSSASGDFYWVDFDPFVVDRAVAAEEFTRRLYISTDRGNNWTAAAPIPSAQAFTGAMGTTAGRLAIGTFEGFYLSEDGGQSLALRNAGIHTPDLQAIVASQAVPVRTYASFFGGLDGVHLRTANGWQLTNVAQMFSGLPRLPISSLATEAGYSAVVYAGTRHGLHRSTDAGNSWSLLSSFANSPPGFIAVDPSDPLVLYVTRVGQGLMRSEDGGLNWTDRTNGLPFDNTVAQVAAVFVDPGDPERLYAICGTDSGLYRSTDSGQNWSRVAGGLPANEAIRTVAIDPVDNRRIYVGAQSGLYRSVDSGSTWVSTPLPVLSLSIGSVLIDPVYPGTIMAVAQYGAPGVLRSVDYGMSWERLPWGTPYEAPPAKTGVLDPGQAGAIIVGAEGRGVYEFLVGVDVSVALSGLASPVPVGGTPTLRITARNEIGSGHSVSDATVSVTLPSILASGTVSTSRGSCTRALHYLDCHTGALKPGETMQIDVSLTTTPGSGDVVVSVLPYETDTAMDENEVILPVTVRPLADLRSELSAPATADRGSAMALQGRLVNLGPNTATDSVMVLTLPVGLTVNPAGLPGNCNANGATFTCLVGSVPAGGSVAVALQANALQAGVHRVSAAVSSGVLDTDAANNSVTRDVVVKPVSDLAITFGAPASLQAGQAATATATVTNLGPDPVDIATATLSGVNLTLTAASPAGGSCSVTAGVASCSLGTLAAGTSRSVSLTFSPGAAGAGQLTGSTNSEATDGVQGNNSSSVSMAISAPPPPPPPPPAGSSGSNGDSGSSSSGGSSGGGGAVDLWGLLALLLWVGRHRQLIAGTSRPG